MDDKFLPAILVQDEVIPLRVQRNRSPIFDCPSPAQKHGIQLHASFKFGSPPFTCVCAIPVFLVRFQARGVTRLPRVTGRPTKQSAPSGF